MLDNHYEHENSQKFQKPMNVKNYIGLLLIGCALAIMFWIFGEVYRVFDNPLELTVFQKLIASNLETVVSWNSGEAKLTIPPEFVAYMIPVIFLGIAVRLAGMLLVSGSQLLSNPSPSSREKMDRMIQ